MFRSSPPKEPSGAPAHRWRSVHASRWLPLGALLVALSSVFVFVGDHGYLYGSDLHNANTGKNLGLVANLSLEHPFLFHTKRHRANGTLRYELYNRFPLGAFVLIALATAPFDGDLSAQIVAARVLMLAFFCAAAVLAYLALARALADRAIALAATLLAFSSYHLLDYSDIVSNETSVGLFTVMLVFHGMVLLRERGRFWQLVVKVCVALLLDWHVYGLLLPFLALGLVAEVGKAWANGGARGPLVRVGVAAGRAARSEPAQLGAFALLFGLGVLGYNLAQEYTVLEGKRAFAELPSVRSMLNRTWGGRAVWPELNWPTFLVWQLHRVGTMLLPFGLSNGIDFDERAWRASGAPSLLWLGLVAAAGCAAGIAGLPRRHRPAFAALALSGFCWALLAPGNAAFAGHQYEAMFHVGAAVVLFATALSAIRRRWRRVAGPAIAAGAVAVFALSSWAVAAAHHNPDAARQARARLAEFDAISAAVRGKTVLIAAHPRELQFAAEHTLLSAATAGAFVYYADSFDATRHAAVAALDFVVAFERHDLPSLYTPSHRFAFLHEAGSDAGGVLAAMLAARRQDWQRLGAAKLVARSGFDIRYVPGEGQGGGEVVFLRASCGKDDTVGRFYLRTHPVAAADLSGWQARLGGERRDFYFHRHGYLFDDKCLLRVPLPRWPVANVYAGQYGAGARPLTWHAAFRLDFDRLRATRDAAAAGEPAARSLFDLHLRDGELIYLRARCSADDVRARFFLHVVPDAASALPANRRRAGFDNRDFDFPEHGAFIDGGCVALLPLPDYDIAVVRTGQFSPDWGVAWQAELTPASPARAGR